MALRSVMRDCCRLCAVLVQETPKPAMASASSLLSRQLQGWICRGMVTRQGVGTSEHDPTKTSSVRRRIGSARHAMRTGDLL